MRASSLWVPRQQKVRLLLGQQKRWSSRIYLHLHLHNHGEDSSHWPDGVLHALPKPSALIGPAQRVSRPATRPCAIAQELLRTRTALRQTRTSRRRLSRNGNPDVEPAACHPYARRSNWDGRFRYGVEACSVTASSSSWRRRMSGVARDQPGSKA